ncbi:hypothetical protein AAF712_000660 [Marasmius tenuissimus]|uniref:Uncharacterized protein n=1 Tax=Marasmius tenuissimus TaxID=585030 RepID=A0ABR3ADT6_9AGAR|nr:hypothetical protein PM082_002492 [Marasmius tenuissimus]
MSTRRRVGVSAATTEAARRQLMQPVACWEKQWVTPENAPVGSTFKIYRWVKTEKIPEFLDDDGGVDEPLAPLPDEPEVVDVEDDDQEEKDAPETQPATQPATEPPSREPEREPELDVSKPPSPKPQLTMTTAGETASMTVDETGDDLGDTTLKAMDTDTDAGGIGSVLDAEPGMQLDMTGLAPDGLALEGEHDLSQMEGADPLLGGPIMDSTMDPFSEQPMDQ